MTERRWKKLFAENLNRRMDEKGLSQTDLARKSDISQPCVGRYMDGSVVPTGWRLVNIAKVLECSVDDLVDFGEMVINFR